MAARAAEPTERVDELLVLLKPVCRGEVIDEDDRAARAHALPKG